MCFLLFIFGAEYGLTSVTVGIHPAIDSLPSSASSVGPLDEQYFGELCGSENEMQVPIPIRPLQILPITLPLHILPITLTTPTTDDSTPRSPHSPASSSFGYPSSEYFPCPHREEENPIALTTREGTPPPLDTTFFGSLYDSDYETEEGVSKNSIADTVCPRLLLMKQLEELERCLLFYTKHYTQMQGVEVQ